MDEAANNARRLSKLVLNANKMKDLITQSSLSDATNFSTEESLAEPLIDRKQRERDYQKAKRADIQQVNYFDRKEDMTYARRIALFLSRFGCYYPLRREHEADDLLSLEAGWEYFEHVTLARHFKVNPEDQDKNKKQQLDRAEPGEVDRPTQLYGVWSTSADQLGDFGIGIGIYFDTILWLAMITFLGGLGSTYNIYYYSGPDYSDYQSEVDMETEYMLKGSVICDDTEWVVCDGCVEEDWSDQGAGMFINSVTFNLFVLNLQCHSRCR